jgi:hypothetical protein
VYVESTLNAAGHEISATANNLGQFRIMAGKAHSGGMVPETFDLGQNYPNPFNPNTDIRYQIVDAGSPIHTTLKVYNVLGQEVRVLVDELKEPGYYTVTWDGTDHKGERVTSGVYFYRIVAGQFQSTRRMVLLK